MWYIFAPSGFTAHLSWGFTPHTSKTYLMNFNETLLAFLHFCKLNWASPKTSTKCVKVRVAVVLFRFIKLQIDFRTKTNWAQSKLHITQVFSSIKNYTFYFVKFRALGLRNEKILNVKVFPWMKVSRECITNQKMPF